jgi:membrane associated rhomboid family serine protease
MEQQTEAQSLVGRGDALLAGGEPLQAAEAYARAVQADPAAVGGHLGLAEANLALGAYGTVYLACRQVQTLAPGSADAALARAILFVLERRYDAAVHELDHVAQLDPGRAYAHALRAYSLRQLGQSYDAQQAEGKARRLSSGKDFSELFPRVAPNPLVPANPQAQLVSNGYAPPPPPPRDPIFEQQRQALRLRLASRGYPIVTYTLIAVNVIVYVLTALTAGGDFINPSNHNSVLYDYGVQVSSLMQQDPLQWYRVFTAMFLHVSIVHVGVNMLSLYFVGVATEQLFGRWRFATIYFVGGIIGGVAQYFISLSTAPNEPSLGASGAIFAIFGAFGAFVILRRSALGRAANAIIGQWIFWLLLNLVIGFSPGSNIGVADHIGGLVAGFILGALLIPRLFKAST